MNLFSTIFIMQLMIAEGEMVEVSILIDDDVLCNKKEERMAILS